MPIVKGTRITLPQVLIDEGYDLGKRRHLSNRKNGVEDQCRANTSWYQIDGEGVCGEFAFAQLVSAPQSEWDKIRTISPMSAELQSDQGDCGYLGRSVDVKTTKYATGNLIIVNSKLRNLTDAYALITGFRGEYVFRGAITKEAILANLNLFEHHHTNSVWIDQRFLTDLPS